MVSALFVRKDTRLTLPLSGPGVSRALLESDAEVQQWPPLSETGLESLDSPRASSKGVVVFHLRSPTSLR